MPDRSRKRPRDLNQLAKSIVDEATGQTDALPTLPLQLTKRIGLI
jgi:hypothetical protein